MAARMDRIPTTPPRPRQTHRPILPRWVGALFPIVLLAAVGAWIAYSVNRTIVPFALALAASAGLGLLAGFSARWALRHRPALVRTLAAMAAVTVGLHLLGLMTTGEAGIGMSGLPLSGPNLNGMIQLGVGMLTAWMALSAWRVRVRPEPSPLRLPEPTRAERWAALSESLLSPARQIGSLRYGLARGLTSTWDRVRNRDVQPAAANARPPSRGPRHRAAKLQLSAHKPQSLSPNPQPPAPDPEPPVRSSGWRSALLKLRPGRESVLNWRRRSIVRMGETAEQRCPYCFDVVHKNDPRGVVVCPICRTPHHADCWAVTGMCQIPHSHS